MMNQRDIILVPFPFSDQSRKKVRPAVVVSNDKFNNSSQDIIIMGITSNVMKNHYSINISSVQLEEGKLFDDCCIKVENILKIHKELAIKKIGRINRETFTNATDILKEIMSA